MVIGERPHSNKKEKEEVIRYLSVSFSLFHIHGLSSFLFIFIGAMSETERKRNQISP
jgi:hypothetical protein